MSAHAEQSIGHYTVLEKLGEGGMGTVFKARDKRLDRTVALKMLSAGKVDQRRRSQRFLREARSASALNHPNIITVHDIGEHEGADYIVMEYVSGRTLAQCIASSGLSVSTTLQYSVQIADALAAAHQAGIVHCDLKPANIMITESGLVKVLDFGLAKMAFTDISRNETTATMGATKQTGMIVGTVPYMSPEQVEGKRLDARSDIFSFGAVLYEMVTGRSAFEGGSSVATLAAVLRGQPKPMREIVSGVPPDLELIVARCLEKDASRRFRRAADVKIALENVKQTASMVQQLARHSDPGTGCVRRETRSGPIEKASILSQLERILAAPEFARSDRGARFFRLIVERTLEGRVELLKESLLAIDAFGRPPDFDPKADPVVRVEAIKLRRRLEDYYARLPNEAVRISIPKGHYVAEFHHRHEQSPPRRIVVLPVEDRQGPADRAWLAAGLTDELISALSRIPGLLVVCRKSSAGNTQDFRLAAGVRWDQDRVRLSARLIAAGDLVLWSEHFDGAPEASISVQESIAAAVAAQLGLSISDMASFRRPVVPVARDWCLRGRFEMHAPSLGSAGRARACFDRAITLDPDFAEPYTQIVRNLLMSAIAGQCLPDALLAEAQTFLGRAMALDADAAETHLARGTLLSRFLYQWAEGEESFRCALALDPALADAYHALAHECLLPQGRFAEALAANRRAVELEPQSQLFRVGGPWIRLFAGEITEARAAFDQMMVEDPSFLYAQAGAGYAALLAGDTPSAVRLMQPFATVMPMASAYLVMCYARAGQIDLARSLRDRVLSGEITPMVAGIIEFAMGDLDAALHHFARAIDGHDSNACYLGIDPLFGPLRNSPRFLPLLECLALSPHR